MVAFIPSLSLWMVGFLCVYQFLKPRLPKYAFRIQKMRPHWFDNQFRAKLGAGVWMRNDNYVHLDIHALSCDIYYPDWDGGLNYIGHIHDAQQVTRRQLELPATGGGSDDLAEIKLREKRSAPLWRIPARQTFETNDHVMMIPVKLGWGVLSSLFFDLIRKYGTINLPSSMVIHIKANKKIPLTLNILCDNELNAWSLEMMGITCELDSVAVGWYDLASEVTKLRSSVIDGHQPLPLDEEKRTSIVGRKPAPPNFHDEFEKATKRIDWRDVPILAF